MKAYFVSIDPSATRPKIMNTYVSNVSKRITGVTGDPAKVAAMTKGYNIYVKKIDADDGNYNMDHTASVILLDKGGGFAGTIAYQESAETAVAKLKRLADKS
jgi:protein SCO1/2